jgi:hypothetical protein
MICVVRERHSDCAREMRVEVVRGVVVARLLSRVLSSARRVHIRALRMLSSDSALCVHCQFFIGKRVVELAYLKARLRSCPSSPVS